MPSLQDLHRKQSRYAEHYWQVLLVDKPQFDLDWNQIQQAHAWLAMHMQDDKYLAFLCMQYCGHGWDALTQRYPLAVRTQWAKAAVQAAKIVDDREAQAQFLSALGESYGFAGEYAHGLETAQMALRLARQIGQPRRILHALDVVGSAYIDTRELDQAIKTYEEALKLAETVGEAMIIGDMAVGLADCYLGLDRFAQAAKLYQRALQVFIQIGDQPGEARALQGLGSACFWLNGIHKAEKHLKRALHLSNRIGDRNTEMIALRNLGLVYSQIGNLDKALTYFMQCLTLAKATGHENIASKARDGLAKIAIRKLEMELDIDGLKGKLESARKRSAQGEINLLERQIRWFYTIVNGVIGLEGATLKKTEVLLSMAMNLATQDHDYDTATTYCKKALRFLPASDPNAALARQWLQEYQQHQRP